MLLKILTLLKDEKFRDINKLNSIVEKSKTEHDFNEAIAPHIKSSPADFKTKWADHGFGTSKISLWETLLKNYFNSSIETTLQSLLKISLGDITNNVEAVHKVIREVAQDLASSGFTYGGNIHKAVQGSVRTVFMNNRQKYRKEFRVFQNDSEINPTIMEDFATPLKRITNGLEALRNIPASEVKVILADLHGTSHSYKFDTITSSNFYYSMYESFLRVYFEHEMAGFNETYKGQANITLSDHIENKYKKLDQIMRAVFSDYILPGISKVNIKDLENTVFLVTKKETVNNTAPAFGQRQLDDPTLEGNFGNNFTFAKSAAAKQKFDNLIKGFVALSKLYHYLRDAGFTPYHIHADIFSLEFGDPSMKFLTLAEVVEYSSQHMRTRYKYNLKEPSTNFSALQSKDGSGTLLPINYDDVILANRNAIVLENLTSSVVNLTTEDADSCYATMHMVDTRQKINIFKLANAITGELNPLYYVFQDEGCEWDNDDPEEVWDKPVMIDYFSYLLNTDASNYELFELDRNSFLEMSEKATGDLGDLLRDMMAIDLEVELKILLALEAFVKEFKKLTDAFNAKYKDCRVSEIEYSTFMYNHPMFQDLHDIVDPTIYRTSGDNLVSKVTLVLLQKHYPELTFEQLFEFLIRSPKNISYGNFIDSLQSRTFRDITSYFHSAKANLFNLSEHGVPIKLRGSALEHAIQNAPLITNIAEHDKYHANIRKDRHGYYINSLGDLYRIISYNNKTGALHSSGLYIFTDGSAKVWSRSFL